MDKEVKKDLKKIYCWLKDQEKNIKHSFRYGKSYTITLTAPAVVNFLIKLSEILLSFSKYIRSIADNVRSLSKGG